MFHQVLLACVLLHFREARIINNNTAVLITKYAKVAHWGAQANTSTSSTMNPTQARSNVDAYYLPQRSDFMKPTINHTSKKKLNSKADNGRSENIPVVGEVQERFNPKPYFNYKQIPPNILSNKANSAGTPQQPTVPIYNSFPVFPQTSKPSVDLYTSPYDSYNPPTDNNNEGTDQQNFPPNAPLPQVSPSKDTYASAPVVNNGPYFPTIATESSKDDNPPALGPPSSQDTQQYDDNNAKDHEPYFASTDDLSPEQIPSDNDTKNIGDGPPNYPPKDEHDIYYPPDDNIHDTMMIKPADMGEQDLQPPASDTDADNGDTRFPQYLYDHAPYNFDHHHVYQEISHPTTTTEQPEQRVNTAHYSYYYLGRKLWYIPLYFSVYFIIYVTVLILKSIARHKVQLKHQFTDDKRKARDLSFYDKINDLHKNVTQAINNVSETYG